jgi:hypothetical protein
MFTGRESFANGIQLKYEYPNGYGASVVLHDASYGSSAGLFEVAVTHNDGQLCYSTPITGDVIGSASFAEVAQILERIEGLPSNPYCTHASQPAFTR